jgi:hypothetical protein
MRANLRALGVRHMERPLAFLVAREDIQGGEADGVPPAFLARADEVIE